MLEKYLETPGYRVFFHMRTWGQACSPQTDSRIDVGINLKELVIAFAPDIAKLRPQEQLHWAHYFVLPDGEVCTELFETRMQQNPPHSPGFLDIIAGARTSLQDTCLRRFSGEL